jgi:hypothetical protein
VVSLPTERDGVPWRPECLPDVVPAGAELREQWTYVVLEEIVDDVAELMHWPWPLADQHGRLYWPDGDEARARAVAVPLRLLQTQLYARNGLRRRPRSGDTFASPSTGPGWDAAAPVEDVRRLFPDAVFDVSAEAREAAKLAYQGALAAVEHASGDEPLLRAARERRVQQPAPQLSITAPPDAADTADDEELA